MSSSAQKIVDSDKAPGLIVRLHWIDAQREKKSSQSVRITNVNHSSYLMRNAQFRRWEIIHFVMPILSVMKFDEKEIVCETTVSNFRQYRDRKKYSPKTRSEFKQMFSWRNVEKSRWQPHSQNACHTNVQRLSDICFLPPIIFKIIIVFYWKTQTKPRIQDVCNFKISRAQFFIRIYFGVLYNSWQ